MTTDIEQTISTIRNAFTTIKPDIALVLGSGLGHVSELLEDCQGLAYAAIPGFSAPSVRGHTGELLYGTVGSRKVLIMQGRSHSYESGDPAIMKTPIQAIAGLGCKKIILTCAAGSLEQQSGPGSIMLINDHINLTGFSPLTGETGDKRFIDLTDAYDKTTRNTFKKLAKEQGFSLKEGVYMWFPGPNFETPAEIRAASILGAHAVGMSIVPETILARHAGLEVAALAVITNYASGCSDEKLSHEQTIKSASTSEARVVALISAYLNQ